MRRREADRLLTEEIESCLDIIAAENEQKMPSAEARRLALIEFGGREQVKERVREVRMGARIQSLWMDTRHVLRGLSRNPSFTVVVVLTFALGIGANTAIFSFIDAVFIHPLQVKDPSSLVAIYTSDYSSTPYGSSSYPDYVDMRENLRSISEMAAIDGSQLVMDGERLDALTVTANYFSVLGLTPEYGRFFGPDDESPAAERTVVISKALWSRRFQSDPGAMGRLLHLSDQTYRIIGVAPQAFRGTQLGAVTDAWIPMTVTPSLQQRGSRGLSVIARLKSGTFIQEAQSELAVLANHLARSFPDSNLGTLQAPDRPRPIIAVSLNEAATGNMDRRQTMSRLAAILSVVVGIVLVIACANVASLLVARSRENERDTAIRVAIGAARGRIVSRFLIESLVLSYAGAVVGLMLGEWLKPIALSFGPFATLGDVDVRLNLLVLGFTFVVATLCGVVLGLAAALAAMRRNTAIALKGSDAPRGVRKISIADILVVTQVSLSLVLLVAAGLFIQSLINSQNIDPGFRITRGVLARLNISGAVSSGPAGVALYEQIRDRLETIAGPDAAAFAAQLPLSGGGGRTVIAVNGYTPRPGEDMEININTVDAAYFKVMGIDITAGRSFDSSDTPTAVPVTIVNEEMARRYWPDGNAIGRTISTSNGTLEVIGVARSGKYRQLHEENLPLFYLPLAQDPQTAMNLIVKTMTNGAPMVPTIRAALKEVDSRIPVFELRTVEDHIDLVLAPERANVQLFSSFGFLAALLAFFGTYGVMRCVVQQRVREMGIRIALGARSRDVLYLILSRGMLLAATGVASGAVLSFALSQTLSAVLHGVSPSNVRPYVAAAVVQIILLLVASYLPARYATRVDPLLALRP